jgi:cyclin-dependent kinase 7
MEDSRKYIKERQLGRGAYGKIYLVSCKGKQMALKRIKTNNQEGVDLSAIREIKILREIDHVNIIRIFDVFAEKQKRMCLLMEYIPYDLRNLINNKSCIFNELEAVEIVYQILRALEFLHTKAILHRDVKPSNILLTENSQCKLIDFGLARTFDAKDDPLTKNVCTRWYRSPEILYGAQYYGTKVDIWAMGCVFAELVLGKPLFMGSSEIDQLSKIFGVRGIPDTKTWPEVKKLPLYFEFEDCFEVPMKKILVNASSKMVSAVEKMLNLNPRRRPSASELLELPLFAEHDHEKALASLTQKLKELDIKH